MTFRHCLVQMIALPTRRARAPMQDSTVLLLAAEALRTVTSAWFLVADFTSYSPRPLRRQPANHRADPHLPRVCKISLVKFLCWVDGRSPASTRRCRFVPVDQLMTPDDKTRPYCWSSNTVPPESPVHAPSPACAPSQGLDQCENKKKNVLQVPGCRLNHKIVGATVAAAFPCAATVRHAGDGEFRP